jgi:hypothetical protein
LNTLAAFTAQNPYELGLDVHSLFGCRKKAAPNASKRSDDPYL